MAPPDSPDSPLSSLASDDFGDDSRVLDAPMSAQRPSPSKRAASSSLPVAAKSPSMSKPSAKRRRTGTHSRESTTRGGDNAPSSARVPQKKHDVGDTAPGSPSAQSISSDTSGEVPSSPTAQALIGGTVEDDYSGVMQDQVTLCQWEGCDGRDFGDMDALVKHIHDEHIGTRQRKYLCEWNYCPRKGQTHASGYALRAHMRSHTKEKPFYCSLPECDRSFTRSDALSKHMRTVHEPEALRVLDNETSTPGVTASATLASNKASKAPRIKLKFSQAQPTEDDKSKIHNQEEDGPNAASDNHDTTATATTTTTQQNSTADPSPSAPEFGPELGFDEKELALPVEKLHSLLRRQVHWAEKERDELDRTCEIVQRLRKGAWLEKELILQDVMRLEGQIFKGTSALVDDLDETMPSADDLDDGLNRDDDDTKDSAIEAAPS